MMSLDGRIHIMQPWAFIPGPLALLIAAALPYRWLFFLAYAWLLLLLGCYLWVRLLARSLELQRTLLVPWAEVGDLLEERWELVNRSWLPLLWLELDDASSVPGYSSRRVVASGPQETQRWETSARCTRRGVYALGPLQLRFADPLGLIGAAWQAREIRQVVVYPALVRLPALPPVRGQSGGLACTDLLQQAATPNVGSLRAYVPGDLPSRIHWPTVARTRMLMVKEFDQERAGALWVAVDLNAPTIVGALPTNAVDAVDTIARGYSQSSLIDDAAPIHPTDPVELAIVLAGSLAAQAISQGRAVGLIANDGSRQIVSPGSGPQQLWRILTTLVELQVGGGSATDLVARGPGTPYARTAGAGLVLVTADLSGRWMPGLASWQSSMGHGARVMLVGRAGVRADDLIGRLAGLGIVSQFVRVGDPLSLLRPPRPRPALRVSPLGKIRVSMP
jgi:uncharacterized protein (DUF58 family)